MRLLGVTAVPIPDDAGYVLDDSRTSRTLPHPVAVIRPRNLGHAVVVV